jgi:hypothetical protein
MELQGMKADLHRYLRVGRESLVWKLDGLSEYDIRRPMTPTGTNLLGIVKHVATVEAGYLGDVMGRSFGESFPWSDESHEANADMWATSDESRDEIVGLYRRVWAHSDATIESIDLATVGTVPWWPEGRNVVTLHRLLLHMIAETHRHAGHADLVRETIDGAAGLRADNSNLPDRDADWWADYRDRLEAAARAADNSTSQ